jgi:hypothetical protein
MKAARRQPDQTELEDLRASAALWGQGVSRTYSAGTKRTAVPPGGYSPSVIANVQARRLSPGTLVAHNWPTKSCNHPAGSRPPGVRAQLLAVGLSRTKRDPARTGHRASTCGNTDPEGTVPVRNPRPRRPWAAPVQAADLPRSGPQLAHNWPTDTGNGPLNRSRPHIRPGPQTGPDLQLCVAGVGFEPT